ncbi:MAG: cyclase/dehydrase [Verrucomicrobiales bacterium]|nr:cyclase/dehydrase [Verrucomicrobiales bacterium]
MDEINSGSETHPDSPSVQGNHGIKVTKSCTIKSSRETLYAFWRKFENLPLFMNGLVSVTQNGNSSHWIAKSPGGKKVEWDAVVINETLNELIAWRTVEGSDVSHAGSVRFKPAPGNRGTEVTVKFEYDAPGGKLAAKLAKITGKEPSQQVEKDLTHFKAVIETGEFPTTQGQPKGEK